MQEPAPNDETHVQNQCRKTKALVVQCIADSYLKYVRDQPSAYEMWNHLWSTFEKRRHTVTVVYTQTFVTAKILRR